MKIDFSDSTKQQILNIIADTEGLYCADVGAVDLFVCKETDSADYEVCQNEIENYVCSANSGVIDTNSSLNDLVQVMDDIYYTAQQLDEEYKLIVEENVGNTAQPYMDDLEILVNAIEITGESAVDFRELPIFNNPALFEEDLNCKLEERMYNDLVLENGEIDYEYLREIMQDDSLTDRELVVLTNLVNNEFVNDDGTINCEAMEKFLECSYRGDVYLSTEKDCEMINYSLTGAYKEFADFYNNYTFIVTQDNSIGTIANSDEYKAIMAINGIFQSTKSNYDNMEYDMYLMDDEINDWVSSKVDFTLSENSIDDYDGYLLLEVNNDGRENSIIMNYDNVSEAITDCETVLLQMGKTDPNQVYVDTINSGVADMISSELDGAVTGTIPGNDWINLALDIHNLDEQAQEAYNNQVAENEHIDLQVDQNKYEEFMDNASGIDSPAFGTVICYGDQITITNQTIDEDKLRQSLMLYNENSGNAPIEVDDITNAIYYPTELNSDGVPYIDVVTAYVNWTPE